MKRAKNIGFSLFFLAGMVLVSVNSCTKSENTSPTTTGLPVLTTTAISNITSASATSGGTITNDGGDSITARGVCWGTSQNPTISDNKTSNGKGKGSFASTITGLNVSTTYYVRAYATNTNGTSYGTSLSLTTGGNALKTKLIGSYAPLTDHYGSNIFVSGNYAYFCEKKNSWTDSYVRILDISTPTTPTLKGSYYVGGLISAIRVANGYMYLGLNNILYELQTVSLANLASPILTSKDANLHPLDIAISGSALYTTGTYAGDADYIQRDFNSFSLTNPATPTRIGSYYKSDGSGNIYSDSYGVAVQGNYAFVAASTRGLVVLNISNPTTPVYAGGFNSSIPNGYSSHVSISGNYAAVMNTQSAIELLNISNVGSITQAGTYTPSTGCYPSDFVLSGNYLYVAEGTNGLRIIDVSNPASPVVAGYYKPSNPDPVFNSLFVNGQDIYIADNNYGLMIVRFTP
jgi:Uncharacterized conserved protein